MKRNRIHKLQLPNGTLSTDCTTLQNEAQNYFKKLFNNNNQHGHFHPFKEGTYPIIDEIGKNSLTSPITKPLALNSMKPYKAPCPDGFYCIFLNNIGT